MNEVLSQPPPPQQGGAARVHLHDFSRIGHHLPEALWAASDDTFCEELVAFLVQRLGCVHPSEATIQKLVVLSMLKSATVNVALKTPWESKRAFVDVVKGLVKKYRGDNQAAYVIEYITSLPTSPLAFRRQYPRQYQHAYAGAEPGPCQYSRSDIQQLVSAVPMRTSLRRLASFGCSGEAYSSSCSGANTARSKLFCSAGAVNSIRSSVCAC